MCSKIGVKLVLGVELARANPAGVGALGEYRVLKRFRYNNVNRKAINYLTKYYSLY